jgi:hypothetical protein
MGLTPPSPLPDAPLRVAWRDPSSSLLPSTPTHISPAGDNASAGAGWRDSATFPSPLFNPSQSPQQADVPAQSKAETPNDGVDSTVPFWLQTAAPTVGSSVEFPPPPQPPFSDDPFERAAWRLRRPVRVEGRGESGLVDFFRSIPGGALTGFSNVLSSAGQAESAEMAQPMDIPTPDQTEKALTDNVTGELPKPEGRAGQFGAAVGGALANPSSYVGFGAGSVGANVLRNVVLPAFLSEAAGQATEGTAAEPWVRAAAPFASPFLRSRRGSAPVPNRGRSGKEPPAGESPQQQSMELGSRDVEPAAVTTSGVLGTKPVRSDVGGAMQPATRAAGESPLASMNPDIYDPPNKPQRPFESDYPPARYRKGLPADATGRLTHDTKGRPLIAQYVVGRRAVGGADEALSPAELDAIAEKALGGRYQVVPASALPRGTVGIYDPNTGGILVYKGLPAETKDMVAAHEIAHGINDKGGSYVDRKHANMIPMTPAMLKELKPVYNDLNNRQLALARAKNPTVDPADVWAGTEAAPESYGYRGAHVPAEYMAEAVRAAMVNPNYMKTVAPKTYAAIANSMNSHPWLSKIIQFNTLAGIAALNGLDPGASPIWRQPAQEQNTRWD